ncbi:Trypsin eta [Amphibalanus amphitrite]|uniref:Trypsin eta n=1 Tax=Amphibalanus amphitrite TaxID=1232801 RepID=A0A6A4VLM8_AMPAM|nr:Trypsin eta [Amphibalanus amphitrite]
MHRGPCSLHDYRLVGAVNWVASLQFRHSNSHFCGGTVIGDYWVLTAAHCMQSVRADQFQVVTGGTNLDGTGLQVRYPVNVTIANYDDNMKSNDLALIRTGTPLEPSTRITGAVVSPAEQRPAAGTECQVLGWGLTKQGGRTVRQLRWTTVTTQSNDRCQAEFRTNGYTISETMLCAGQPGRDACQGDSGGPLVCRADGTPLGDGGAPTSELRLAGAVSWGVGCATPGLPGVYADVAGMAAWLRAAIGEE